MLRPDLQLIEQCGDVRHDGVPHRAVTPIDRHVRPIRRLPGTLGLLRESAADRDNVRRIRDVVVADCGRLAGRQLEAVPVQSGEPSNS